MVIVSENFQGVTPSSESPNHVVREEHEYASPVSIITEGVYLWVIVGVFVGVLTVVLLLTVVCLCSRRREAVSKATPKKLEAQAIKKCCGFTSTAFQLSTSTENTTDSANLPEDDRAKHSRRLQHSLSMDVGSPFYSLRKHSVQPRCSLPRWNSLTSPSNSIDSLGTIQPDLYKSSDSEDCASPPTDAGRLWFSALYKKEETELEITLIRAKYLPGRGLTNGCRDPFVKIFLLPDEEHFQQSKVRKRTLSPKFNETFIFKVNEEEMRSRCLRFSVYDVDKRKVRHCLGHAIVALAKLDLDSNSAIWRDLEKTTQIHSEGDLQVSLMCNPYNNKLKVSVCKIENVQGLDSGEAYVYTKVHLFHGHKLVKSKRTASQHVVGQRKAELIFHETMSFSVPARFYDSCFLELITVVSGSTMVRDVPLGKVTIGPFLFSRGEQLLHWQEMITNPRNLVTRWHRLEPAN